jgi:hypothetical protein
MLHKDQNCKDILKMTMVKISKNSLAIDRIV